MCVTATLPWLIDSIFILYLKETLAIATLNILWQIKCVSQWSICLFPSPIVKWTKHVVVFWSYANAKRTIRRGDSRITKRTDKNNFFVFPSVVRNILIFNTLVAVWQGGKWLSNVRQSDSARFTCISFGNNYVLLCETGPTRTNPRKKLILSTEKKNRLIFIQLFELPDDVAFRFYEMRANFQFRINFFFHGKITHVTVPSIQN